LLVVSLAVAAVVLSACAVPGERDDLTLRKKAADAGEIDAIFDRYRETRDAAIDLLDPKPLSTVETGPVLAIDSGAFEVSQRLSTTQRGLSRGLVVTHVETPAFSKYPLWFLATAYDPSAKVNRVQVFERDSAVDPWLLVDAPQTLPEATLPEIRHGSHGAALTVKPDDGAGMAMSPQEAADAYAQVLADPASASSTQVERDDFVRQMRKAAETNGSLKGVTFTQTWAAEDVQHALRTDDGGALVFVTLLRQDTYDVQDGVTVTWPSGSPQQAFLASGISSSGKLRYYHQVLLYVPSGDRKPRALGQYGGVVGADGV
jgi:hypothetical protein